ncbi:hypothetical protein ACFVHI_20480 [Kitasatospora sp. NPDC127121]
MGVGAQAYCPWVDGLYTVEEAWRLVAVNRRLKKAQCRPKLLDG